MNFAGVNYANDLRMLSYHLKSETIPSDYLYNSYTLTRGPDNSMLHTWYRTMHFDMILLGDLMGGNGVSKVKNIVQRATDMYFAGNRDLSLDQISSTVVVFDTTNALLYAEEMAFIFNYYYRESLAYGPEFAYEFVDAIADYVEAEQIKFNVG